MKTKIISSTIQEFGGTRYYRCGFYFQHKGKRLHRAVWEVHNGEIPDGMHVHHADEDTSNNDISNLCLLRGEQHLGHHARKFGHGKWTVKIAQRAAVVWHGSEKGREWHREQYEKHCKGAMHRTTRKSCEFCSEGYDGLGHSRFCSNNCKSAARRASGVDDVDRICCICGSVFRRNKYSVGRTCSRKCGKKLE